MKRSIYGVLGLALLFAVGMALSASAQATGTPQGSMSSQSPGAAPSTESQGQAKTSYEGNQGWRAVAFLQSGGSDADKFQFGVLDANVKTLEDAITQLHRLSSNASQNAADIVHWTTIRDESANRIATIVASYFLSQRLMPFDMQQAMLSQGSSQGSSQAGAQATTPGQSPAATSSTATQSERAQAGMEGSQNQAQRQAYDKMLETAHKVLVHTYLAKETSDPAHVRELQSEVANLRQEAGTQQRQLQAEMKQRGIKPEQGMQAFRSGAMPGYGAPTPGASSSTTGTPGTSGATSGTGSSSGSSSSPNP